MDVGRLCEKYLLELSEYSDSEIGLTRLYLTEQHKQANKLISKWMKGVGLTVHVDNVGNVVGHYDCGDVTKPTLILGSHQDSVVQGGIYDGMLGIVVPILAIKQLGLGNLHFHLKIVAFGDEEGARFGTTYIGSKALTGSFSNELLQLKDENGITLEDALEAFGLDPSKIYQDKMTENNIDYLEIHIEQGPVLEDVGEPLGIVEGIIASRRYEIIIDGHAGHAGNLPMDKRQDAAVVMAYIMTYIHKLANESKNFVATIGKVQVEPNAINVIPGKAKFSLDIRSPKIKTIEQVLENILIELDELSRKNGTTFQYKTLSNSSGCVCAPRMKQLIRKGMEEVGIQPTYLYSGAGHDAEEMKKIANVGMIFVRCKDGLSHHPDEYVDVADLEKSILVLIEVLKQYSVESM